MQRKLSVGQQQLIGGFRERKEKNRGSKYMHRDPETPEKDFCRGCEIEMIVSENVPEAQTPSHCTECKILIEEGLMALATGRLYEITEDGHRCFKEGDGSGYITVADINAAAALLANDLSTVAVRHIREECMIRLKISVED